MGDNVGDKTTEKVADKVGDNTDMLMEERYLKEFRRDYRQDGKYKLEGQVCHLARLAEHHQNKYETTRNWTDCLKAHALYNSCGVRKPASEGWDERAFQMQQFFWNEKCTITYEEHVNLTKSLRAELETIRTDCRNALKDIDSLAQMFQIGEPSISGLPRKFVDLMKESSVYCTDAMLLLSKRVIAESVKLLTKQPPCIFNAVAIGSMARGEATPYSDLEYMFLVENSSPESLKYFEDLAVTSYFLMGNFRETKLSYMNIQELKGWFDDKAQNGFKIDGLAPGAGNIPTGNGKEKGQNYFIVTPEEIAKRYHEILINPGPDSLQGDLTSMMTYMKSFYSYGESAESLLTNFLRETSEIHPGDSRISVNRQMLKADLTKFDFCPDSTLEHCGFTVDVKKEIYRFPSILLFDLCTLWGISGMTSWESAGRLLDREKISTDLYEKLTFLLACACYIRLSAYLCHNSHDDRISVAQQCSSTISNQSKQRAYQRWYVQIGLFTKMSDQMIPLKRSLAHIDMESLDDLCIKATGCTEFNLAHAQTLHSCGRYTDAYKHLFDFYGYDLLNKPMLVIERISNTSDQGYETLVLVSDVLFKSSHHTVALDFSLCILEQEKNLKNIKRVADCLSELSRFKEALDILQSSTHDSGDLDLRLGDIHCQLGNYEEAEKFLISALQKYCSRASTEEIFDYYGNVIEMNKPEFEDLFVLSPAARLDCIQNASTDVAETVSSLRYVYSCRGDYELVEKYNAKFVELLPELYGGEALVVGTVVALCETGNLLYRLNLGRKAEEIYIKSLRLCEEIFGVDTNHMEIATLLSILGHSNNSMNKYHISKGYFERALKMVYNLYGENVKHVKIAELKCEIGWCYNRTEEYVKAGTWLTESLNMYRCIYGDQSYHQSIANVLVRLGVNLQAMNLLVKANQHYQQALTMYESREESDEGNECIAAVLGHIGGGHRAARRYDLAHEYYDRSLAMYKEIYNNTNAHLNVAMALGHIGDLFQCERKYEEAHSLYIPTVFYMTSLTTLKG